MQWWQRSMRACGWMLAGAALFLLGGGLAPQARAAGLSDKMQELIREQQERERQQPQPQRPKPGPLPDTLPGHKPPPYQPPTQPAPPPALPKPAKPAPIPPPAVQPPPDRRPPVVHHDRPRPPHFRPGSSWRRDRCWDLWGGHGSAYRRCMDGAPDYLYPSVRRYERYEPGPTVIIEEPPPVIRYRAPEPELPPSLLVERFPLWYAPRLSGVAVVTLEDIERIPRSFHLAGIEPGDNMDLLDGCIARYLDVARMPVNEIAPFSEVRGADAEALLFVNGTALNIQLLAEGCARFDDRGCRELGMDICEIMLEAENSARRNGLGLWR